MRGIQPCSSVSDLKKKIIELWDVLIANPTTFPDLHDIAVHQKNVYATTVEAAQQNREEAILKDALRKERLRSVAGNLGAIPPAAHGVPGPVAIPSGARGVRGGGRAQHSTNLCLGEPAAAVHVHKKYASKKHRLDDNSSNEKATGDGNVASGGKPPANRRRNTNDIANAAKVDLAAAAKELKSMQNLSGDLFKILKQDKEEAAEERRANAEAMAEATTKALAPFLRQMQSAASQFTSFATLMRTQHLLEAMIRAEREGDVELHNELQKKCLKIVSEYK